MCGPRRRPLVLLLALLLRAIISYQYWWREHAMPKRILRTVPIDDAASSRDFKPWGAAHRAGFAVWRGRNPRTLARQRLVLVVLLLGVLCIDVDQSFGYDHLQLRRSRVFGWASEAGGMSS